MQELGKRGRADAEKFFARRIAPALSPLPGAPFPFVADRALTLALALESERGARRVVLLALPELPRLVRAGKRRRFVLLEDLVASQLARVFPGERPRASVVFRVLRNANIAITDDVEDLLQSVETELQRRERREVVWLEAETEADADGHLLAWLVAQLGVAGDDVYVAPGPLQLADLLQLHELDDDPALKDPPFRPSLPARFAAGDDIFSVIRDGDVLLYRPYDSFAPVVELLRAAAGDPHVVAVRQTLYRTDRGSPIVKALAQAARAGKQVTAVVELQARFDEKKNITWARHLEDAGVEVVYGLAGLKTHCKLCLVVRREDGALRNYVHLSTGNYNATTARTYVDLDLFTCDPDFGADAAQLIDLLRGCSIATPWRRFVVAPDDYQAWVLEKIERGTRNAEAGKPARIVAKLNALADPLVIDALDRAGAAGVRVELLVRGICCLVPRENVTVTSVVDRFLEHARVFELENGGETEVWISSGDWMPRNFVRRIEVAFPVLDPSLRARIADEILPVAAADNVKSWTLQPDGRYRRARASDRPVRSQEVFIRAAAAASASTPAPRDGRSSAGRSSRPSSKRGRRGAPRGRA